MKPQELNVRITTYGVAWLEDKLLHVKFFGQSEEAYNSFWTHVYLVTSKLKGQYPSIHAAMDDTVDQGAPVVIRAKVQNIVISVEDYNAQAPTD